MPEKVSEALLQGVSLLHTFRGGGVLTKKWSSQAPRRKKSESIYSRYSRREQRFRRRPNMSHQLRTPLRCQQRDGDIDSTRFIE